MHVWRLRLSCASPAAGLVWEERGGMGWIESGFGDESVVVVSVCVCLGVSSFLCVLVCVRMCVCVCVWVCVVLCVCVWVCVECVGVGVEKSAFQCVLCVCVSWCGVCCKKVWLVPCVWVCLGNADDVVFWEQCTTKKVLCLCVSGLC